MDFEQAFDDLVYERFNEPGILLSRITDAPWTKRAPVAFKSEIDYTRKLINDLHQAVMEVRRLHFEYEKNKAERIELASMSSSEYNRLAELCQKIKQDLNVAQMKYNAVLNNLKCITD